MNGDERPDILCLTHDLCDFAVGAVSQDNELLFERIKQELPVTLHRYTSGSTFNGWQVPQRWQVEKAVISRNGRQLFDGTEHTLGVASYSTSFQGELDFEELKLHLVTNPDLPEAYVYHCMWLYRPWAADWALCVPNEVYKTFEAGRYQVDLVTSYAPGEMLVGEYECRGRSDQTIVFNCHTCHPHMANDAFAGVALLIRLFQWLQEQDTYYTYRLVLGPEHLGSVFYLRDQCEAQLERLVCGVFPEMVGTAGPIRVASTFLGDQPIDKAFSNAVRHYSEDYNLVPWRHGAGNDETVWEAAGYEVPFLEVTRCLDSNFPYPEYHTSLDKPDLMDVELMDEFYQVMKRVVNTLEQNSVLYRKFNGLIALSNPEYDLYFEQHDPAVKKDLGEDAEKWGRLLNSLFRYLDGSISILDIAEKHDLPFDRLYEYLLKFEKKGLVDFEFAPVERVPISPIRKLEGSRNG